MNLRHKLTPLAATLLLATGAVSVQAEEKDPLNLSGFIDMSYYYSDDDGDKSTVSGLDQAEIDIEYDFGNKLSVRADIEYQNGDQGVDLEQAFMNYAFTDKFSIKAGRFLSYSGWEAEEPTGLYQYSGTGYAPYFYGYYQQGVSALYSDDWFAAAISFVNDLDNPQATDAESPAIETMFALMPTDEITIKAFYSTGDLAGTDETTTKINTWASYVEGPLTLAVEYNMSENASAYAGMGGTEGSGYLAMANYAFANDFGLTLRYNAWDIENAAGASVEDATGITISPSYTVNDNLLMVFEYRMDEVNGVDVNSAAVEALVTF